MNDSEEFKPSLKQINEELITYTTFQTIQKKHFPLITKSKLVPCFRC